WRRAPTRVHLPVTFFYRSSRVSSAEGLINRGALRGEHLRAAFGDVEAVFQTDTEFAVDGDHRLVAEAHSGLDAGLVAAHEVGPFVSVESDAVAGAVRQARHLVIRAEAGVGDHLARGGVHRLAGRSRPGRGQCGVLRFALQIPDATLALGRLAENERARDVGLIPLDGAPAVHQHHVAFLQLLRLDAAVREGRVLSEADQGR